MNLPTIIALIVVVAIVGLVIWKMIRDKKQGKGGCSCGCSSCSCGCDTSKKDKQ